MRKLIISLMLAISIGAFGAVGDRSALPASNVIEIKKETSVTAKGNEKTDIIVIYQDANGKRKLAYMTNSDYRKLEQAQKYSLDIEYELIECKTKFKVTVK